MLKWINENYLDDYENGTLHTKHCQLVPFKHAVLENFFNEDTVSLLEKTSLNTQIEVMKNKGIAKDTDWYSGPFYEAQFLSFFYGKEFRTFLNELMQEELMVKSKSIPQLNVFKAGSKGIPVHTDSNYDVGIITLIQLSRGYNNVNGGELILYKNDQENNKVVEFKKVKPILNTLILFQSSGNSYHSVADMSGIWERRVIALDWYTKKMLLEKKNLNTQMNS